ITLLPDRRDQYALPTLFTHTTPGSTHIPPDQQTHCMAHRSLSPRSARQCLHNQACTVADTAFSLRSRRRTQREKRLHLSRRNNRASYSSSALAATATRRIELALEMDTDAFSTPYRNKPENRQSASSRPSKHLPDGRQSIPRTTIRDSTTSKTKRPSR